MIGYIVRRVLLMIPTLLVISMIVFAIIELPPGDYLESYVAELQARGETVNEDEIAFLREQYGFGQPLVQRYVDWVWGMLHGDFGYSFEYRLARIRSRRRPDLPDHRGLSRNRHLHLAGRVSDRHLLRHPSIQLGRLRPDISRSARSGDAELPVSPSFCSISPMSGSAPRSAA